MKRFILLIVFSLLTACGNLEPTPNSVPLSGQQVAPSPNTTATSERQTLVAGAQTSEAGYWAMEQRFANETMTAFADPEPTMDINNLPTLEPYTIIPEPTWEYRIITHAECDRIREEGEQNPVFLTNCWHGILNGKDLIVRAGGNHSTNYGIISVDGDVSPTSYRYPDPLGPVTILAEQLPNLKVSVGDSLQVLFNLETRQWLRLDGTPITGTPTPTYDASSAIFTPTPTGPYITSLTLINADTDQPIPLFTPLEEGAKLDVSVIGSHLSIRAETEPFYVGSVQFDLDGRPWRIENMAPYSINGDTNIGSDDDYTAWTPSPGYHTLKVIPFTGPNATGDEGQGVYIGFDVLPWSGKTTPTP